MRVKKTHPKHVVETDQRGRIPNTKGNVPIKTGQLYNMTGLSRRNSPKGRKYLYICVGGWVQSQDGDRHWVSCCRLPGLYKVDSKDCLFLPDGFPPTQEADGRLIHPKLAGMDSRQFTILRPQSSGDYTIPQKEQGA